MISRTVPVEMIEVIKKVMADNPYTDYSFSAQNKLVERGRAERHAMLIALEVTKATAGHYVCECGWEDEQPAEPAAATDGQVEQMKLAADNAYHPYWLRTVLRKAADRIEQLTKQLADAQIAILAERERAGLWFEKFDAAEQRALQAETALAETHDYEKLWDELRSANRKLEAALAQSRDEVLEAEQRALQAEQSRDKVRESQLEAALKAASYALFEIKRMVGVPDFVRLHAINACDAAIKVIDYESAHPIEMQPVPTLPPSETKE